MEDPTRINPLDSAQVQSVLERVFEAFGVEGLLQQGCALPGLRVERGRPGKLFRAATPTTITHGDDQLSWLAGSVVELTHVVNNIVLSSRTVHPRELPGILAAMVSRAAQVEGPAALDVALSSLRDSLDVGGY